MFPLMRTLNYQMAVFSFHCAIVFIVYHDSKSSIAQASRTSDSPPPANTALSTLAETTSGSPTGLFWYMFGQPLKGHLAIKKSFFFIGFLHTLIEKNIFFPGRSHFLNIYNPYSGASEATESGRAPKLSIQEFKSVGIQR